MSSEAAADLQQRMAPTDTQIAAGVAAIREHSCDFAVAALAFPGKTYGFWTVGQPVEHPDGIWPCANGPVFHDALEAAEQAAAAHLDGRDGTVGYTVISPDGTWAVFESPRNLGRGSS